MTNETEELDLQNADELYHKYFSVLYRIATRRIEHAGLYCDEIEESIHETLLIAMETSSTLSRHPNPTGWMVRTFLHRLLPKVKARTAHSRRYALSIDDSNSNRPDLQYHECRITAFETEEFLSQLMDSLDQKEREIFQYYFVEGQTMKTVSFRCHVTENRVRVILRNIRKKAYKLHFDYQ